MKKNLTVAFAFMLVSALSAQIKQYVGIVREKHYPSVDEFLDELASSLKSRGHSSYANYVEAYRAGGFGSGFIYVDKDGTNYVVTNRHVVSQAASASIEFENDDGSMTKFENLSVLITDDDIDLAILTFEGGKNPFKKGLLINTGKLSDGQDVVSAGFPGLAGEPVWQFGKGSITNSAARIKDLIDPTISTVIQHSAQIDAGNSGGPLLIASKSAETGYEVVGINTWKAAGRDSTNFSIPAGLVLKLLEQSKNPEDDSVLKNKRVEKFKTVLTDSNSDYTELVKFVSYDLAATEGIDCLDDILRHAPTKVTNQVGAEFAYNPIEGLRYAVAYNLYSDFSGENASEENLNKIEWQKEHGLYRISSLGGKKKKQKQKQSSSDSSKKDKSKSDGIPEVSFNGFDSPYQFALGGGMTFITDYDKPEAKLSNTFDLSMHVFPVFNFVGIVAEFEMGEYQGKSVKALGVAPVVRIPLDFGLFCIMPKAEAGIKVGFSDPTCTQFFWGAGVETTFNFGSKWLRPGLEISYRNIYGKYSFKEDYTSDPLEVKSSGLLIKALLGLYF